MATWNPEGSLHFEKTDKYQTGRIKGKWEDALKSEIPEANERAWNQGAEEVTDGKVDSAAEVKAVGDWYRKQKEGEVVPETTTPEPETPAVDSPQLAEAKERVENWNQRMWSGEHANDLWGPNKEVKKFDFTNDQYVSPTANNKSNAIAASDAQASQLLDTYKTKLSGAPDEPVESTSTLFPSNKKPPASPVSNFSSANN